MKRKTAVQIIRETTRYYSANPVERRGKNGVACVYINPTNPKCKCAVGRVLDPTHPFVSKLTEPQYNSANGGSASVLRTEAHAADKANTLDDLLLEQYRGQSEAFWLDLQSFHDGESNWDKTGITNYGKQRSQDLLEKYK